MSAESELRAVLIADAALTALVPAARISIDTVMQGAARPYIAFSKQATQVLGGLNGSVHARRVSLDIQVVGSSRSNAIAVREQVEATLAAAGVPFEDNPAAYDPELDIEVEVLSLDWWLT